MATVAATALMAGSASAGTALYAASDKHTPPELAGARLIWGEARSTGLVVRAVPAAGGPPVVLGTLKREAFSWTLAASATTIAARGDDRLYVARGGAPFGAPLATGWDTAETFGLAVAGDDIVSVDAKEFLSDEGRVVSRPAGAAPVEITLPRGARLNTLAVGGDNLAVLVGTAQRASAVAIIDRRTGAEVRRIPVPAGDLEDPFGVVVADDGAVALYDLIAPVAGWAPPGATAFSSVSLPVGGRVLGIELLALAKDRLVVRHDGRLHVVALTPGAAAAQLIYRTPPSSDLQFGAFDGDRLSWRTLTCGLIATVPAPPESRVPPGACFRAEVALGVERLEGRDWLMPMECVTTVGRACRGTVSLRVLGRRAGRAQRVTIPRGGERLIRVRLPRTAAARLRKRGGPMFVHVATRLVLSDGAGKRKVFTR